MNLKKTSLILLLPIIMLFLVLASTASAAPPALTPTPSQAAFGNGDIHSLNPSTIQVNFQNTSGGILTVESDAITGPDSSVFEIVTDTCAGGTFNINAPCAVFVSFDPSDVGSKQAELQLTTDAGMVSVPLSGTGATGTLTGTAPVFLQLPYAMIGSQVQSATFSNGSSYIVDPGQGKVKLTGADAKDFSVDYEGSYNGCNYLIYPTGSCIVTVAFTPEAPGTYNAQLELSNDGTVNPVIVPLTATALVGPHIVVSTPRYDFGDVAIGSSSPPKTFTVSNTGDYPAMFTQLLPVGSDPDRFPITNDSCSMATLAPGESCSFTAAYSPTNPGLSNMSVDLIGSVQQPTLIPLQGNGVPAPNGSVSIKGTSQVTKKLTCSPSGFPSGTAFSYQWKRGTTVIKGATAASYTPVSADVGRLVSCVLSAGNSVGSNQLVSSSVRISRLNLSGLPGSLVNSQLSRSVKIDGKLKAGGKTVSVNVANPVDAADPLVLRASVPMTVRIDGKVFGRGQVVSISPRALSWFSNGAHALSVTSRGHTSNAKLSLATTPLTASVSGGTFMPTALVVSSLHQLRKVTIQLPKGMAVNQRISDLGTVQFQSAVVPTQSFVLDHSGRYNGVHLVIKKHAIVITDFSAQTGQFRIHFRSGALLGNGGVFGVSSGSGPTPLQVKARADWN